MKYTRSWPNTPHMHSYYCLKAHKKVEAGTFIKELSALTATIAVLFVLAVVLVG